MPWWLYCASKVGGAMARGILVKATFAAIPGGGESIVFTGVAGIYRVLKLIRKKHRVLVCFHVLLVACHGSFKAFRLCLEACHR